jgi:hypothetical protein
MTDSEKQGWTYTNDYRAQADACESVTTLRRLVHELADRADALVDGTRHAVDEIGRLVETYADGEESPLARELHHLQTHLLGTITDDNGDPMETRADTLERERDALAAGLDRDTRSRYAMIDRLNALKRALRRLVDDIKRGWMGDAMSEAQAVLADQPAQDGGRGATPENVNDYLDGHDNGLNVGYRQGWDDALERAAQVADERSAALLDEAKAARLSAWSTAHQMTGEAGQIRKVARAIRNLQSDQPADAGEPSCCVRTREECARIAERENDMHAVYDDWSRAPDVIAAAIRRTGDTP